MKKVLMTAALLIVSATSFADITTPVNVSLDVVETSQLVLMDGNTQLTQIDLKHPQILLTSAKVTTNPSVVRQNFKVQSGDGQIMKVDSKIVNELTYKLEGPASGGLLELKSGTNKLSSMLSLARDSESIGTSGASDGLENTITSTIAPTALNGLTASGTYAGMATLKVVVSTATTVPGGY